VSFAAAPIGNPYELFLQLEGIEHRTPKVKSPLTNGFVERLHRRILDEHFRIVVARSRTNSLTRCSTT